MDDDLASKNPFEIKIHEPIDNHHNPFLGLNTSFNIPQSASFMSTLGLNVSSHVAQSKSLIDLLSLDGSNLSPQKSSSASSLVQLQQQQQSEQNTATLDALFDLNNNSLQLSTDPFQPSSSYFDLIGLTKSASQLISENQNQIQNTNANFFDDFFDLKISPLKDIEMPMIEISEPMNEKNDDHIVTEDMFNLKYEAPHSAQQSRATSPLPKNEISCIETRERQNSLSESEDDADEKRLKQMIIRPKSTVQTQSKSSSSAQFSIPLLCKPPKTSEEIQSFNSQRFKIPTTQMAVPIVREESCSEDEVVLEVHTKEDNQMPTKKTNKRESNESSFELELPDEDDQAPLDDFFQRNPSIQVGEEGWLLSIRHPLRNPQLLMKNAFQKITEIRSWSDAYVKIVDNGRKLQLFYPHDQTQSFHEVELKSGYKFTELAIQQFDTFTKIHTFKIQDVLFKETMQLRTDRLISLPEKFFKHFTKPKMTSLLDHTPIPFEIIKFAHLNYKYLAEFTSVLHENFWKLPTLTRKQQREQQHQQKLYANSTASQQHTREEITIKVVDEYKCRLDKHGRILEHRCRTRVYLTAFINDAEPTIEIGLNDCMRHGKEIVSRHDIIPVKTENWIAPELFELNEQVVNKEEFDKTHCLRCTNMPDNHIIEIMRYRTRPRRNYELPLRVACHMSILGKSVEIRLECTANGSYFNKLNEVYCEHIQIRFPLPDTWVYLFRVEKRFRYGALHSKKSKLGKLKGLERFLVSHKTTSPSSTNAVMEASCGRAKYEQAFKSIVWRIEQLPAKNKDVYKTQLFVCRLTLQEYDNVPEVFEPHADISYTMPICAASKSQVRSISVNTCEESPAKWVKLKTRFQYEMAISYVLDPSEAPVFNTENCDELKHMSQTESEDNEGDEDEEGDSGDEKKSNLIDF